MPAAVAIRVRGVVQGVGFRPFVYRLARRNTLAGWVLNAGEGVDIFLEGPDAALRAFVRDLERESPSAAVITDVDVSDAAPTGLADFHIRESRPAAAPTVRIAPDLPVCDACLSELFDPSDRRYLYPYINCTDCGPRYSVVLALPYDRANTTMAAWPLDAACAAEYANPTDRRFHAEPTACPACGPSYDLRLATGAFCGDVAPSLVGPAALEGAVGRLRAGEIVAVKGLGGYHLACNAADSAAVDALRARKYRKEKPFALMVRDLAVARAIADLTPASETLLSSAARPIVLVRGRVPWPGVAPDTDELGLLLPYAPLHHLLFAAGAPEVLVMTSANRSSEPMAYRDEEAVATLTGIADAWLVGGRPIARRVDDSVVRETACGPMMLRRSRGYTPGVVASLPATRPILAVGADLKNAITLVVAGQALVSQHIGDLEYHEARLAFRQTVADLVAMYRVDWDDVRVVHDAHPQYVSTMEALGLPAGERRAVQHHRAHVASVLAERQDWDRRVVGVSLDGTGYGDDGAIWGGEFFVGSVAEGFERVGHLRPARLVGGDAAARHPVRAAAGFVAELDGLPDLTAPPFSLGDEYLRSSRLLARGVRTFPTTSIGRLFDAAAALAGFTRAVSYEGQAAMWLEHLATRAAVQAPYPFPVVEGTLDFRPLVEAIVTDRLARRDPAAIARAFHAGVAQGVARLAAQTCEAHNLDTVVCSGGVFQNGLLRGDVNARLAAVGLKLWTNHAVPPNDGGISLGQAAMAAFLPAGAPAAGR